MQHFPTESSDFKNTSPLLRRMANSMHPAGPILSKYFKIKIGLLKYQLQIIYQHLPINLTKSLQKFIIVMHKCWNDCATRRLESPFSDTEWVAWTCSDGSCSCFVKNICMEPFHGGLRVEVPASELEPALLQRFDFLPILPEGKRGVG